MLKSIATTNAKTVAIIDGVNGDDIEIEVVAWAVTDNGSIVGLGIVGGDVTVLEDLDSLLEYRPDNWRDLKYYGGC
jgi:hypothetical protein